MTMLDQASPSVETPLLDVQDLAQRYTLPRESMNGHTRRYRAYVCHAGCYDWVSMLSDARRFDLISSQL